MHALAVMHTPTLYENVDSAKIKMPFYTTDIDILRVASMHRIVIHCIDISMNRYTPNCYTSECGSLLNKKKNVGRDSVLCTRLLIGFCRVSFALQDCSLLWTNGFKQTKLLETPGICHQREGQSFHRKTQL